MDLYFPIALKFDRRLGSAAAEAPVKFQSDWKIYDAISRLKELLKCNKRACYH